MGGFEALPLHPTDSNLDIRKARQKVRLIQSSERGYVQVWKSVPRAPPISILKAGSEPFLARLQSEPKVPRQKFTGPAGDSIDSDGA